MKGTTRMIDNGPAQGARPKPPPPPPPRKRRPEPVTSVEVLAERLFEEFATSEIPLEQLCRKYLGLDVKEAKRRASLHQLPVVAYRIGSNKAPWLVNVDQLAHHLRAEQAKAEAEYQQCQA